MLRKNVKLLFYALLSLFILFPLSIDVVNAKDNANVQQINLTETERIIIKFKNKIEGISINNKDVQEKHIDWENNIISLPKEYLADYQIRQLMEYGKIEYIEPDYRRQGNSIYDYNHDWDFQSLELEPYLENQKFKEEVIVAVIDSGVDVSHPNLKEHLLPGRNSIEENNNYIDDHGHGTHVTGIVLRATQGVPIKILPVKVLDEEGGGNDSSIAKGIRYAADHGADVINLSLGGTGVSITQQEAIHYAMSQGVFVVVSAGNDSRRIYNYYPASEERALTVGALDRNGEKADFSNYGYKLDLLAPGVDIFSSMNEIGDDDGDIDGYTRWSGTSMSAPFVTGIVASIKSAYPQLTNDEIEILLKAYSEDIYEEGFDMESGFGSLKLTDFDVDKKILLINTPYIKSNEDLVIGVNGFPNGRIDLHVNGELQDSKQANKNGFYTLSVSTFEEDDTDVEVKYYNEEDALLEEIKYNLPIHNKKEINIEIYDSSGNKMDGYGTDLYGVKDNNVEVLSTIFNNYEDTIDTSVIIGEDYDSFILSAKRDGYRDGFFIVREVELDDTLVIETKDLPKVNFQSAMFDYPETPKEYFETYDAMDPPLLHFYKEIEATDEYKITFLKNYLLLFDSIALDEASYDIEFSEDGKNRINFIRQNLLIDRDQDFYLEDVFNYIQVKHDLTNANLASKEVKYSLRMKDGRQGGNSMLLTEDETHFLSQGEYELDVLVADRTAGWYSIEQTIKDIKLDGHKKFIWSGDINTGELSLVLEELPESELVEFESSNRNEEDSTPVMPTIINEITENTKTLLVNMEPLHEVFVQVDSILYSSKVKANEQGFAIVDLEQPLKVGEHLSIVTIEANNQEEQINSYTVKNSKNSSYREWHEIMKVPNNKIFNIDFNQSLSDKVLTDDFFAVKDFAGNNQAISLSLTNNDKTIQITPQDDYKTGEIYSITISDELQSNNQKKIKDGVRFYFYVE